MQKRAMERVREMRQNSENVLETAKNDLEQKRTNNHTSEHNRHESGSVRAKYTNMPPNFPKEKSYPDFKDYFKDEQGKETEKLKNSIAPSATGVLDSILNEPDRALLLGLLLLLKSEGADESLMLALTYIMA